MRVLLVEVAGVVSLQGTGRGIGVFQQVLQVLLEEVVGAVGVAGPAR